MIPVLRRFDHGQSSKLNCWSYKSADIDGMGHRHDPVDFCEWEIIFVGGEWGRGVHAGQSISGAYLLISQNISKYLGQEPNYVSIVSEFVVYDIINNKLELYINIIIIALPTTYNTTTTTHTDHI